MHSLSSFEPASFYDVPLVNILLLGGPSCFHDDDFCSRVQIHSSSSTSVMLGGTKCKGKFVYTLDVARKNRIFGLKLDFYLFDKDEVVVEITNIEPWSIYDQSLGTRVVTYSTEHYMFINLCIDYVDEGTKYDISDLGIIQNKKEVVVSTVYPMDGGKFYVRVNHVTNDNEADLSPYTFGNNKMVQAIQILPLKFEVIFFLFFFTFLKDGPNILLHHVKKKNCRVTLSFFL